MATSIRPARPVAEASDKSIETLQRKENEILASKERTRMSIANVYKNEEKVRVAGSPMYRPYFGNSMPISLNGIAISVPLDGRTYEVPKSFAEVFYTRIRDVDDMITMQKRLSNVTENHETYAGELDLVRLV